MNYGSILRELRVKRGKSIKQLAKAIGIGRTTISTMEVHGRRPFRPDIQAKIANYLKLMPDEIQRLELAARQAPRAEHAGASGIRVGGVTDPGPRDHVHFGRTSHEEPSQAETRDTVPCPPPSPSERPTLVLPPSILKNVFHSKTVSGHTVVVTVEVR
jgi:transcriptional regulator with XRE-family HTH domain